jgi:Cdc6-like AAA superfamily ATPase
MSWIDRINPWRRRRPHSAFQVNDIEYVWREPAEPAPEPVSPGASTLFPRFQTPAGDQLDARTADGFAMVRSKLRNAFTPAQPVTDKRMFAGRTRIMTTLIRSIEDQRLHTVVYGERGIGKTSLLQVLAQAAQEARYLVVYITCGVRSEFDETFRAIASHIPLMYHSAYGPTTPEGERGDTLASLLGPEPMTVSSASDALAKIEGTRVLVILDEYDRANSEDFRRSVAELLKSLSDQAVRVQVLIAGVAANLTELVANVPSIQRNVFAMRIPKMTADEIRDIVRNGEAVSELGFEEAATHAIVTRCMGFPYLATLICHRAALVAIDDGRVAINLADVVAATDEVVEEFKGRISRRSQLQIATLVSEGKLAMLGALAGAAQSTGGWFTAEDITAMHADPTAIAEARATADDLADHQILIEAGDEGYGRGYRFSEPTVPVYLWLLAAKGDFYDQEPPEGAASAQWVPGRGFVSNTTPR